MNVESNSVCYVAETYFHFNNLQLSYRVRRLHSNFKTTPGRVSLNFPRCLGVEKHVYRCLGVSFLMKLSISRAASGRMDDWTVSFHWVSCSTFQVRKDFFLRADSMVCAPHGAATSHSTGFPFLAPNKSPTSVRSEPVTLDDTLAKHANPLYHRMSTDYSLNWTWRHHKTECLHQ